VKKPTTVEELLAAQSELMKDMFIAELAVAGVPQREIAKIVRVDLNRVNRLAKSLKRTKRDANGGD
jgi:3-methyladenine DNA glycosylase AlkD